MAGDRAGALAHIDDEAILARIEAGEKPSHVAKALGVHKSAIYHRFAQRPDYLQARENGTEVRIEEVEQEIAESADQFTLSRARERGRIVMWRAEREFPARWGAKTQVTGDIRVEVSINRGVPLDVVDAEVVHTQQPDAITDSGMPD